MAAETRDKILDAAARLFAASDSGGASLRAIARAAGVNSALIHYHFGSREGLFEAVILRALTPVQARRRALLETLRSKRSVSADELAGLFVRPLIPGPLDGADFDDRQDPESHGDGICASRGTRGMRSPRRRFDRVSCGGTRCPRSDFLNPTMRFRRTTLLARDLRIADSHDDD